MKVTNVIKTVMAVDPVAVQAYVAELSQALSGAHQALAESALADREYLPAPEQEEIYDTEPYTPCAPMQRINKKSRMEQ